VVDTSIGENGGKRGVFRFRRTFSSILIVLIAWIRTPLAGSVYVIISSSRLGSFRDFFVISAACLFRKRLILQLHGGGYRDFYKSQPKFYQLILKTVLAKATNIIVLAEPLREQFAFVPDAESKIKVVPNGVPGNLELNPSKRKSLPERGQPLRLLYLSNLIVSKGYLDLIEACNLLKKSGFSDFVCDFCGAFVQTIHDKHGYSNEQLERAFLKRIKELRLDKNAFFHGTVEGKDKEEFLKQAHIFVLPTYYPWEGQPISITEALAFATPVISTPHKGIPEQVIDNYNGYLVQPKEPKCIADAIRRTISSPEGYIQLSSNARTHYEGCFRREDYLKRLITIICDYEYRTVNNESVNNHGLSE
jgi:glycosyltransferase involved in cell wall biosynthesis